MPPPRLIVTGFGPFCNVERNPTEQLVDYLRGQALDALFPGVSVELHVLRVAVSAAERFCEVLREALACSGGGSGDGQLLLVVHLGVDARPGRRPAVALERSAHNECGFSCPDEDGVVLNAGDACCCPPGDPSSPPLGAALETALELPALAEALRRRRDARGGEYEVGISEDAGRFLCNYVYARSLHECRQAAAAAAAAARRAGGHGEKERGPRPPPTALFVHVPPFSVLPERVQREVLVDLLQELVAVMERGQRQGKKA